MPLTIEDGSGVAGANSYVTVAEIRAFADARGLSLPALDIDVEPLAVSATDWLETFRTRYQGSKTSPDQPLQWPRWPVIVDGYQVANDEIPVELKKAQMQAVADAASGVSLTGTGNAQVKREKVDVIEVEYFESQVGTSDSTGGSATAEQMLEPLFGFTSLRVVRV